MILRAPLAALCVAASSAFAQSKVQSSDFRLWASLSLGPSIQSGFERASADLSVWSTYRGISASVRSAGVAQVFEPGEKHDWSVLVGRSARSRFTTVVGGVGLGVASGSTSQGPLSSEAVIAVGGQAIVGFPWVGVGVSAFGSIGDKLRYGGVGLSLAVGHIR